MVGAHTAELSVGAPLLLEVRGVWKSYGDRVAVSDVHLAVRAGEVHGLLGANGAGKTTLLRMLLGLTQRDSGELHVLRRTPAHALAVVPGGIAGFVEAPRFYPHLTGRANLALLAELDGLARREQAGMAKTAEGLLHDVGLERHADVCVASYSSGMRQRLGLAAALLRSPRVVVLDEPTTSLDPRGAREVCLIRKRLAARGVAVVLSSHDMREVESLCSSLTILRAGRVVFSGTMDELRHRSSGDAAGPLAAVAGRRLRTSDDEYAQTIAAEHPQLDVARAADGDGLDIDGAELARDRYTVALGQAGVAVRSLEQATDDLGALFLALTTGPETADPAPLPPPRSPEGRPMRPRFTARGVMIATSVERAKLAARLEVRGVLAACVCVPLAFGAAMRGEAVVPEDTLFGRAIVRSGAALPLVVLGFAAAWVFPLLASVVAADVFAAEYRHGTWPMLLTRSRTASELFIGKAIVASAFSCVVVCLLGVSSAGAGLFLAGNAPLVGLSGTLLAGAHAAGLTAAAWVSVLPPVVAFTALAMLASIAARGSPIGVGLPVAAGLSMQLLSFVQIPEVVRRVLLTTPFLGWHGLFAEPQYLRPLVEGAGVSAAYLVASLSAAYALSRTRDE